MTTPVSLLVLGDSTAFTDATGPQLPATPHLYPNVAARHLAAQLGRDVEVTVVAQPGATVRDALRAATKDRHVQFDLLAHADAVVVGVGSFDHAPAGVPPSVQAVVPYLRPAGLRRQVRTSLHRVYPVVVRLRRGQGARTPPKEFHRLYGDLLDQVRSITWGRAAGAALGPTSHRSDYYGQRHPGHARAEARQLAQARAHGFAAVPVWSRVVEHLDALNVDGIHWPAVVHAAVGADVAAALLPQLTGQAPSTGLPAAYQEHLEAYEAAAAADEE
jgi:diglucosylglycerate octanoyltransferase